MKVINFIMTINTAGQAYQVASGVTAGGQYVRMMSIQAAKSNTSYIGVGNASLTTALGQQLAAGEAHIVNGPSDTVDPTKFYVVGGTVGDIVRVETVIGGA